MKRIKVIIFMVVVALVSGSAVTAIHLASADTVKQNTEFIREQALVELFGLADSSNIKKLSKEEIKNIVSERIDESETIIDTETSWSSRLIKVYTDKTRTKILAYGFTFRGAGFWDTIEGILSINPELTTTLGFMITQQKETPGLGGRVEETFFSKPFEDGLDITQPKSGGEYFYMGTADSKPEIGSLQYKRQFDAISGATQTSLSMKKILNSNIESFTRAMNKRSN